MPQVFQIKIIRKHIVYLYITQKAVSYTHLTQEAIEKVEEYGDYIVVSQGVALAHAGKDSGVIQDGLSVLVSKEGICFRKEQHQVNLVFCFASTGEKEYLDLIKEIVAVGKEQKRLKRILKCNTKEEIYPVSYTHLSGLLSQKCKIF